MSNTVQLYSCTIAGFNVEILDPFGGQPYFRFENESLMLWGCTAYQREALSLANGCLQEWDTNLAVLFLKDAHDNAECNKLHRHGNRG